MECVIIPTNIKMLIKVLGKGCVTSSVLKSTYVQNELGPKVSEL